MSRSTETCCFVFNLSQIPTKRILCNVKENPYGMTRHSSGGNKQNKNFGTAKTGGRQRKTAREDYSSL